MELHQPMRYMSKYLRFLRLVKHSIDVCFFLSVVGLRRSGFNAHVTIVFVLYMMIKKRLSSCGNGQPMIHIDPDLKTNWLVSILLIVSL